MLNSSRPKKIKMKTNTDQNVQARAAEQIPHPEFIRLPKSGTLCRWTGLSRSKLNELILPSPVNNFIPPVRSVSLRKRGQVKGTRLIVFDSLISYLLSLEKPYPSAGINPSNLAHCDNSDPQGVNNTDRSEQH